MLNNYKIINIANSEGVLNEKSFKNRSVAFNTIRSDRV